MRLSRSHEDAGTPSSASHPFAYGSAVSQPSATGAPETPPIGYVIASVILVAIAVVGFSVWLLLEVL